MERFYTLFCLFTLSALASWMLNVKNEQLNYSRIFKDAGKHSRTTRCFSRIKKITRSDSKCKDNSWRSGTSGNLIGHVYCWCLLQWLTAGYHGRSREGIAICFSIIAWQSWRRNRLFAFYLCITCQSDGALYSQVRYSTLAGPPPDLLFSILLDSLLFCCVISSDFTVSSLRCSESRQTRCRC